jgi:hypothetical protein
MKLETFQKMLWLFVRHTSEKMYYFDTKEREE